MAQDAKYGKITTELGKIPDGEPVFLLRGQDKLACKAVRHYSKLRAAAGDSKGAASCLKAAQAMSEWPVKKMPD